MDLISIATGVITVLTPYIKAKLKKFTESKGEAAFKKEIELLNTLKKRFEGDNYALESLSRFEKKPENYRSGLEDILKEKLSKDADLVKELSKLLQEAGPAAEVTIKADEIEGGTGLKVKKMRKGKGKVTIETKKAKDTIGAEIEEMG